MKPDTQPKHTPGPVAWQRFGDEYCLTGQYGHRPIILSTVATIKPRLRLLRNGVLVRFYPEHPDAQHIVRSYNCHDELVEALQRLIRAFEADIERVPGLDVLTCWETNSQAVQQAVTALNHAKP